MFAILTRHCHRGKVVSFGLRGPNTHLAVEVTALPLGGDQSVMVSVMEADLRSLSYQSHEIRSDEALRVLLSILTALESSEHLDGSRVFFS